MDDNGWDQRLYGFRESKYEELLNEVYKLYPYGVDGPNNDVRSVWVPLRLVVDDLDNRLLQNPLAKFEVPVCKEYGNEPEPKVGLVYLLQRHRPEGRVFSNWKNCGSKKANSTVPSTLKVRYFQHKAPDLADVRKRVITLTVDNDEAWKLVHVIHKPPRDGSPKRRRIVEVDQSPNVPPLHHAPNLVQLASALHTQQVVLPEREHIFMSALVPNHGPADHRIVVKVLGGEFTRRVQVVWGGVPLPDGVIFRNDQELWLETPFGSAGATVDVCVQEVGEAVWKSNVMQYTYDHLPQDEPLLKRMKAVEDKITQFESIMARFTPGTANNDGHSTNNNNNNSEEVERFLTQLGNLDKVLDEARQLFRDINAHFAARYPPPQNVARRAEQLAMSVDALQKQRGTKRAAPAIIEIGDAERPRPQRTTEAEHHALMALAGLAADPSSSPLRQGDSSPLDSPPHVQAVPQGSTTDTYPEAQATTPIYYCASCDIHCASEATWADHLSSRRHLAGRVKCLGPNDYLCETCGVQCSSQQLMDAHINTPSHIKAHNGPVQTA